MDLARDRTWDHFEERELGQLPDRVARAGRRVEPGPEPTGHEVLLDENFAAEAANGQLVCVLHVAEERRRRGPSARRRLGVRPRRRSRCGTGSTCDLSASIEAAGVEASSVGVGKKACDTGRRATATVLANELASRRISGLLG